jgi:hypothetical protein
MGKQKVCHAKILGDIKKYRPLNVFYLILEKTNYSVFLFQVKKSPSPCVTGRQSKAGEK